MSLYIRYQPMTLGGGGGGGGTVTSVGFADGSTVPIFGITNSPVTSSGTITETLLAQAANTVFAGPVSGGNAQPGFRALVAADIPSLSGLYANTTLSNLGTTAVNANIQPVSSLSGLTLGSAGFQWSGVYSSLATLGTISTNIIEAIGSTITLANNTALGGGYTLAFTGSSSGAVTLAAQAAAGTYNFNLPTTAGTSGYYLTSGGGSSSPMTWSAPTDGTVTSIGMSVPAFLSVTPATITTSGTFALTYSGTALPIANGGTAATSAAAGTVPNATSTTAAGWTATPTLGVAGTTTGQLLLANGAGGGATLTLTSAQTTNETLSFPVITAADTVDTLGLAQTLTGLKTFAITNTATSGSQYGLEITPTYNQASGNAANTDLYINRTNTAVGSGTQLLINAAVGGSSKFAVSTLGNVTGINNVTASGLINVTAGDTPGIQITPSTTTEAGVYKVTNAGGNLTFGLDGSTGEFWGVGNYAAVIDAPAAIVLQSAGTTALTINTSQVVSLANALPVTSGGTGQKTAAAAFNALSPITTTGDLIYSPSGATNQRLAIGSTGNVLTVSGGVPAWAPLATIGTVPVISVLSYNSGGTTFTGSRSVAAGTLVSSVSSFSGLYPGLAISGTDIPSGAYIVSLNTGASTLVMSAAATGTSSAAITPSSTNGTYVVPSPAPLYLEVIAFGGGGGGAGTGGTPGAAQAGGNTSFSSGTTLIEGLGGNPGSSITGGAGGSATTGSAITSVYGINAGAGGGGAQNGVANVDIPGGMGGANPMGGAGANGGGNVAGGAGVGFTGGGGGGAGGLSAGNSGGGGGAGGYVLGIVPNPTAGATLTFTIGNGGNGSTGGTNAGGNGGSGGIIATAKYQ